MNYYDPASFRSPQTKTEVKQAAKILFVLGIVFGLGALIGGIMWLINGGSDAAIFAVVLGIIAPLLFAAGAYNIYYTRRMRHHPFMAKALDNPAITVCVIMLVIIALVFGGIGLLIFFK